MQKQPALSGREAAHLFRMLALARQRERPLLPAVASLGSLAGLPQLRRLAPAVQAAGEEGVVPNLGEAVSRGIDAPGASFLGVLARAGLPAEGLRGLSAWFGSRARSRLGLARAIAYPLTLTVASIFAASLLLAVTMGSAVAGQIDRLYQGLGARLPLPTRLVLAGYRFQERLFENPFTALLYVVLLAALVAWILRLGLSFHRSRPALWLGLGRYLRWQAAASLSESLGLLLRAGVPLNEAFGLAVSTVEHDHLRRGLLAVAPRLLSGENLGECLRESPSLPASVGWRIWSAYFGSALPAELASIAALARAELAAEERRIQSAVGVLTWCLGGVAFLPFLLVMISFFLPMFHLLSVLG